MTFEEILDHAIAMLQRRGRLTYGTLKRQFQLDDAALEDLKNELIEGQRLAVDERGNVLVWTGDTAASAAPAAAPAPVQAQALLTYTPPHLTERSSRPAPPWKASASRSPCSLPTSRTRRSSSGGSIPKPPSSSSIRPSTA